MADLQLIPCKKCDGKMRTNKFNKHSKVLTIGLIVFGVLISLTIVGMIIGVPIVLFGIHLGSQEDLYWVCDKCKHRLKKQW